MRLRTSAFLAFILCAMLSARAEDTKPVQMAEVSVASLSALTKQITALGAPVPPILTPQVINQMFAFLGGIDENAPAQISFFVGKDLKKAEQAVFNLGALKPGTFEKLIQDQGTKPAAEGEHIYPLGEVAIRFDTNRVMFGGNPALLKAVDSAPLEHLFTDSPNLMSLVVDVLSVRQKQPALLKSMMEDIRKKEPIDTSASESKQKGEEYGRELSLRYMEETLQRVDLNLYSKDGALGLNAVVAPAVDWRSAQDAYPMPALPEECALRLDVAFTAPTADAWRKTIEAILEKTQPGEKEKNAMLLPFMGSFPAAHWAGEATSIGVVITEAAPIGYAVRQISNDTDIAATLKSLAADAAKVAEQVKEREILRVEEYATAAGDKVVREVILSKGMAVLYVDFLKKGKRVYMTASATDQKLVEAMPLEKDVPGAQIKKGAALQFDPARLSAALRNIPGANVPPPLLEALSAIKTPIVLKCEPADTYLKFDLAVPIEAIKTVLQVLTPR